MLWYGHHAIDGEIYFQTDGYAVLFIETVKQPLSPSARFHCSSASKCLIQHSVYTNRPLVLQKLCKVKRRRWTFALEFYCAKFSPSRQRSFLTLSRPLGRCPYNGVVPFHVCARVRYITLRCCWLLQEAEQCGLVCVLDFRKDWNVSGSRWTLEALSGSVHAWKCVESGRISISQVLWHESIRHMQ